MFHQVAVDWLERRAKISPKTIALIDAETGGETTYADWNRRANKTARYLKEVHGVEQGDIVSILSTNNTEYLDLIFACNKLGAILQCLNWRLTLPEISRLVEHAGPKVYIYGEDFVELTKHLDDNLQSSTYESQPSAMKFIALHAKAKEHHAAFSDRVTFCDDAVVIPSMPDSEPWFICYTGGSTGTPKGVILNYSMVTANALNTITSWDLDKNDVTTLNAPLFHTSGLNIFTLPFVFIGATSVMCNGYDVDQLYQVIKTRRISVFFAVPAVFNMMLNHPQWDRADFTGFKFMVSGGAPCPQSIISAFQDRGVNFAIGYGLTEAGPNTFVLPGEQVRTKAGAVGYPLYGIDVKIVDKHNRTIDTPHVIGELLIRGAHRTPGYFRNHIATTSAIDADGWLHTKDLASFDEDGAYTIVGRQNDTFISGGENIYPAEVENVLYQHPAIFEACVFGLPDSKWGEVGCAVISLKPGSESITKDDLVNYLRASLAKYKVPLYIEMVTALPKTGAGKIDRQALKEQRNMKSEEALS